MWLTSSEQEKTAASQLRFPPEAMNYPDNWLLTTDTSPKGSVLLWEPTLQWEAWMYIPGWKWGTRYLMNVPILPRDNHRLEGLSWYLKVWKCFGLRAQPGLWWDRSQLWNLETVPNFSSFWMDIEISLMCKFKVSIDHCVLPPFAPSFSCTSPPLSTWGNKSLPVILLY